MPCNQRRGKQRVGIFHISERENAVNRRAQYGSNGCTAESEEIPQNSLFSLTFHKEPQNPLSDWSLIMGRGRATKWDNHRSEHFARPPPHPPRQAKTFYALPLLMSGNPRLIWLKLQAPVLNYSKTVSALPSGWQTLFPPPPHLFVGVKLRWSPPPVL